MTRTRRLPLAAALAVLAIGPAPSLSDEGVELISPGFVESPLVTPGGGDLSAAIPIAAAYDAQQYESTAGPPQDRSLFQGVDLSIDGVPRFDDGGVGRWSASAAAKFGFPTPWAPVLIKPRYGVNALDGPSGLDVPSTFHDLELGFASFKKLNDRWSLRGVFNLGLYADEDSLGDADALRATGFGMGVYTTSPEWQWVIGAGYLNNQDFSVIPIFGVIHDRGWVKYELTMPRPRVVWTLPQDGCNNRSVYLAGELGGGRWAARRTAGPTAGQTDVLQVSQFAVLLGYESADPVGSTWRYEIGYLFGRDVEYEDTGEELSIDDSLIARVSWSF